MWLVHGVAVATLSLSIEAQLIPRHSNERDAHDFTEFPDFFLADRHDTDLAERNYSGNGDSLLTFWQFCSGHDTTTARVGDRNVSFHTL